MVIYADVLVVLNILVDYFLLKLTAKLLNKSPTIFRLILGSLLGGASSLYIFLPKLPWIAEFLIRFALSLIISLAVFGFSGVKALLRESGVFFCVTFGYAGGMLALWYVFKPSGMAVNNSIVYFNISPSILIVLSAVFYILVSLLRYILSKNNKESSQCEVKIILGQNAIHTKAIVDTGNSLSDAFGLSQVIIVDKSLAQRLLGDLDNTKSKEEMVSRYRVLPCNTVSGTTLLEGYRCDKAYLKYEGNELKLSRPIIAISKTPIEGECKAIINPRSV